MVNWKSLSGSFDKYVLAAFAAKEISGRTFYNWHRNTETGGEARSLLRNRGVTVARQLARKALRRRGVDIDVTK
jgi:hypothetical protein